MISTASVRATSVENPKTMGQGSLWVSRLPVWAKGKPLDPTMQRLVAKRGRTVGSTVEYRVHRERYDGVAWKFVRGSLSQASSTLEIFLRDFEPLGISVL